MWFFKYQSHVKLYVIFHLKLRGEIGGISNGHCWGVQVTGVGGGGTKKVVGVLCFTLSSNF